MKQQLFVTIAFVALLFGLAFACPKARADGLVLPLSDTVSCSPVLGLSGYQYNVKTGDFQKGVALGAGGGCRWTGWRIPLGLEVVGGAGLNSNAPNAAQGSLLFVVNDNYGAGPGVQVFKDPVSGERTWQMLVSFFLTGDWAATVEQLSTAKRNAAAKALRLQAVKPGDDLRGADF